MVPLHFRDVIASMTSYWLFLQVLCVMCVLTKMNELACPSECTCAPALHRIDCSNAGLDRISWNLPNPGTLEQLILAHNDIQSVLSDVTVFTALRELDLSYNQILTIRPRVFNALPRLQYLRLQGNRLRAINQDLFYSAEQTSNLLVLNLENNQISSINEGAFSSLTSLTELYLAGNRLVSLNTGMFRGLRALRSLYINNNDLTELRTEQFTHLAQLEVLVLDMNRINNITDRVFAPLSALRRLSLEGNGISQLPQYLFASNTDNQPPLLERLSLKNNKLRTVPSRTLRELRNLKELDLSHNQFSVVSPDAFLGLTKLEKLILSNCPELIAIRDYSLSELFSLQTVEISSNAKLETIEKNAFISSHNLRSVHLNDNKLTTLDVGLLPWTALDTLVLTGNRWSCDCRIAFLAEVLADLLNDSSMAGFKISEVRCTSPLSLEHRSLIDLSHKDFACTMDNRPTDEPDGPEFSSTIMIAIICTFAGALLTCLFMLLWRTRHQNFHTDPKQSRNYRRRRLHKINREFTTVSADSLREGPKLVSVASLGNTSKRPFATEGPLEGLDIDDDDDVFSNDPDIVASTHGATSISSDDSRSRRVSFSDRVVVRTYECIEETESVETIDNTGLPVESASSSGGAGTGVVGGTAIKIESEA